MPKERRYPRSYDRALRDQLDQLRVRGYAGGVISAHRALLTLPFKSYRIIGSLLLMVAMLLAWFLLRGTVSDTWAGIFDFWRRAMGIDGYVILGRYHIGDWFRFEVPLLRSAATPLSWGIWWGGTLVTALVFLVSFFLPRRLMPYTYMLRSVAFVQVVSQVFFALVPEHFPYSLSGYLEVMMIAGFFLLPLVPFMLGFIYYIFDFTFFQRVGLTLLVLVYLFLMIPMQFMAQAYIMYHGSLLFMPLLFLVFGLPLNVLVFISFYSWGMSWRGIVSREGERPAAARRQWLDRGGDGARPTEEEAR